MRSFFFVSFFVSFFILSCAGSSQKIHVVLEKKVEDHSIGETLLKDGRFTTLTAALEAADLVETLSGEGEFTVFAPSDAAFDKLPKGRVEELLEDIPALKEVLLYHVISGTAMAEDLTKFNSADTLADREIMIKKEAEKMYINDAGITIADMTASNGVIHVVDKVLIPLE